MGARAAVDSRDRRHRRARLLPDHKETATMTTIRFEDQGRLRRAALHMIAAGGLAGLAAHAIARLDPRIGGVADALSVAIIAGAALHGAAPRETRAGRADLALVVLGASVAAFALAAARRGHLGPVWSAALFAVALGFLFARGLGGARLWVAAAVGAGAALLARLGLAEVAAQEPGPLWVAAGLSGAAFGAIALFGVVPRYITVARGPRGEIEEILARARGVVRESERAQGDPAVRGAIAAEVTRLEDVARRWQQLERQAAGSATTESLTARLDEFDRRIVAATDAVARAQFEQAQAEVAQQLRDLESVASARERVLARMHHSLESIERMRTGAVGSEIDCTSHALVEAEEIMHTVNARPEHAEPRV
jgi:hypothetical protein